MSSRLPQPGAAGCAATWPTAGVPLFGQDRASGRAGSAQAHPVLTLTGPRHRKTSLRWPPRPAWRALCARRRRGSSSSASQQPDRAPGAVAAALGLRSCRRAGRRWTRWRRSSPSAAPPRAGKPRAPRAGLIFAPLVEAVAARAAGVRLPRHLATAAEDGARTCLLTIFDPGVAGNRHPGGRPRLAGRGDVRRPRHRAGVVVSPRRRKRPEPYSRLCRSLDHIPLGAGAGRGPGRKPLGSTAAQRSISGCAC